tara:strand:- start:1939 stop:2700 length:762 start_codon:yes stop_codon:yes gene_type:complete
MDKKRVNINPQYFNVSSSNREKKINKSDTKNSFTNENKDDINTNVKNIKELLLKKLKEYKKKKKKKHQYTNTSSIVNSDFIEKLKKRNTEKYVLLDDMKYENKINYDLSYNLNNMNKTYEPIQKNILKIHQPIYGNLKYGKKPTYRNSFKKKIRTEVEKKFILGKNKSLKKIGIFIKNNISRRNVENDKLNLNKTKIKTVKNYLKNHNLIKYGSYAPNDLLREIYTNSLLCGNINNCNGDTLIHNYYENKDEE